jgi:hypothetical protein
MGRDEKRVLIETYLKVYNTFNTDGMLAVIHPNIEFKNIAGDEANAVASGVHEFRRLP